MNRAGGFLLAICAVAFLSTLIQAGEMAVFTDGRTLPIASHEAGSEGTWLLRTDGGTMTVASARILSFQEIPAEPDPQPAAPVAAAPETIQARAARLAKELEVEPRLVAAVMAVESSGDPFAVSPKGAAGLMQLMPATARSLGVRDVFDAEQNLRAGISHLKGLLARYHGDYGLALAAYNAGQGAVLKHKGIPPYRETTDYVVKVLKHYLAE